MSLLTLTHRYINTYFDTRNDSITPLLSHAHRWHCGSCSPDRRTTQQWKAEGKLRYDNNHKYSLCTTRAIPGQCTWIGASSFLIMYKSPSYCSPRLIAKVARAEPWNSSVRRFTSSLVLPVPSDLWKSFPCFFLWHPQLLVKFSICIPRLQHSTSGYRERRGVIKLFILSENRKLLL
jgi:hypothetical protein